MIKDKIFDADIVDNIQEVIKESLGVNMGYDDKIGKYGGWRMKCPCCGGKVKQEEGYETILRCEDCNFVGNLVDFGVE